MSTRELQLQGDIRQAIENYLGDMVSGPWDAVIEVMADVIRDGDITAMQVARLSLALKRTTDKDEGGCRFETCGVCGKTGAEGMRW